MGILPQCRQWQLSGQSGHRNRRTAFSRGPLYALLQNPLYIGRIAHRGQIHDCQHDRIIDEGLWEQVQSQLTNNRTDRKLGTDSKEPSLLAGLVHDANGHLMTPSHANKKGRRYRYYVSTAINDPDPSRVEATSKTAKASSSVAARRVPAADLESLVFDRLHQLLAKPTKLADAIKPLDLDAIAMDQVLNRAVDLSNRWSSQSSRQRRALALAVIDQIDVTDDTISTTLNRVGLTKCLGIECQAAHQPYVPLTLIIPAQLHRSGKGKRIVIEGEAQHCDPALFAVLQKASTVRDDLLSGTYETLDRVSEERSIPNGQATALLRLSWLAPSIVSDTLEGKQPPEPTPNTLLRGSKYLPVRWTKQRAYLGFSPI